MRTCMVIMFCLFYSRANRLATSSICLFLISLLLRSFSLRSNAFLHNLHNVGRSVTTHRHIVAVRGQLAANV